MTKTSVDTKYRLFNHKKVSEMAYVLQSSFHVVPGVQSFVSEDLFEIIDPAISWKILNKILVYKTNISLKTYLEQMFRKKLPTKQLRKLFSLYRQVLIKDHKCQSRIYINENKCNTLFELCALLRWNNNQLELESQMNLQQK